MAKVPTEKLAEVLKRLARQRSDQDAWMMLFSVLWPLVFATSFRSLRGDHALASDVSQEVFLRLYRYSRFAEFIDKPDAFPAYALAVCRNVRRDYLSRIKRDAAFVDQAGEEEVDLRAEFFDSENPESVAIRSNELEVFVSSLDIEDQQLARLLLRGAGTEDIAEALGLSYSNAAVRVHRLRQLARKRLKSG